MVAGYLGQMQQAMLFNNFNLYKSPQINYQHLHNTENLEKENSALKIQLEEKDKMIK